ncbi:sperm acrosome membrane-associated protein 6 isoform X6 [Callithrix jacchus]
MMALLALASAVPSALLALAVFRVPARACLLCFTTYSERFRICQMFVGMQSPKLEECEEAFTAAFQGLSDTEINYDERSHLHDAFAQMTHGLQELAAAQGSFEVAFPDAAEKMKRVITHLKEAQACIPPCGLQEFARRFLCKGCYSRVCDLPLDCPGCDSDSGRPGYVFLHRELQAAQGGDHLFLEVCRRSSGLRTCPISEMCRGPKDTWRGSGRRRSRTAGRSPARSSKTSAPWLGSTSFLTVGRGAAAGASGAGRRAGLVPV